MKTSVKNKRPVPIPYSGTVLLEIPLLNKGAAFSEEERTQLRLHGLVPQTVETIQEQTLRAYSQFSSFKSNINKHIYLRNLQDTNETLFYHLMSEHLTEMMPIIYTPVVGESCERFSEIYRTARGVFVSYSQKDHLDEMIQNVTKTNVKVIVVTDGERILGLGDQGIGGMGIPIGKLSLYTACGGISPAYTLPMVLDVGTNNPQLIQDPFYLGWRHPRITGQQYDDFVDQFIQAVKRRWPHVLLQFEDFAQKNATPILKRYRDQICCFNDDIQGTAAVVLGSLLAACRASGSQLREQTVVLVGGGSAGCGIAEQIISGMTQEGLTDSQARERVFIVDRHGLLTDDMSGLLDFQSCLTQKKSSLKNWGHPGGTLSLLDTVRNAKPTVLIGVSGQPGLFTEEVVREMHKNCARPIVLPLSNPNSRVEALPEDIIRWTEGKALVATGSPFAPVEYAGKSYPIAQCNNSYIFPGIGLGVLASKARRITNGMLMASSRALADCSPLAQGKLGALLPDLANIQAVSKTIAFHVAQAAQQDSVADPMSAEDLRKTIEEIYWVPEYRSYIRPQ
jgi:malate dehydrogenase (oxaloacetate-decarboxylating)